MISYVMYFISFHLGSYINNLQVNQLALHEEPHFLEQLGQQANQIHQQKMESVGTHPHSMMAALNGNKTSSLHHL